MLSVSLACPSSSTTSIPLLLLCLSTITGLSKETWLGHVACQCNGLSQITCEIKDKTDWTVANYYAHSPPTVQGSLLQVVYMWLLTVLLWITWCYSNYDYYHCFVFSDFKYNGMESMLFVSVFTPLVEWKLSMWWLKNLPCPLLPSHDSLIRLLKCRQEKNFGGQNVHPVCLLLRLVLMLACLKRRGLKGAISCNEKKLESEPRKECQTVKDCIRSGADKHLEILSCYALVWHEKED